MGHRDTSAQLGSHGGFFGTGRRTVEAAAASGAHVHASRKLNPPDVAGKSSAFARFATLALLGLVRVYQILLSPFFGGACKFYPSCSSYAFEAIQRHGAGRGFVLAMKRLARCRPFTKGGYDPVPEPEIEKMKRAKPSIEEPA